MTWISPAIGLAGDAIGAVSGLFGDSPDKERFEKTASWYATAVSALPKRNTFEECKLKYFSGRFGVNDCGAGAISGWATQAAKDYAYLLYNQFLAVAAGQLPRSAPVPAPNSIPSVANTAATISEVAAGVSQVAGQVAAQGGVPTTASRLTTTLETGKLVFVGLGVVLIGYLIFRGVRR